MIFDNPKSKKKQSDSIAEQIAEFEKKGGKIERLSNRDSREIIRNLKRGREPDTGSKYL